MRQDIQFRTFSGKNAGLALQSETTGPNTHPNRPYCPVSKDAMGGYGDT